MTLHLTTELLTLHTTHPFIIARGGHSEYRTVMVKVTDADGVEGWGEAAATAFYGETLDTVQAALATYAPLLGNDPSRWRLSGGSKRRWPATRPREWLSPPFMIPRRQAARGAIVALLGARSGQGAAVNLHHRHRYAGDDPAEGG